MITEMYCLPLKLVCVEKKVYGIKNVNKIEHDAKKERHCKMTQTHSNKQDCTLNKSMSFI